MHPWLHQNQLALINRWQRWTRDQPEGAIHLAAVALVAAVLWQPASTALAEFGAHAGPFCRRYPELTGLFAALVSGAVCWRPLGRIWAAISRGLWSAQPRSERSGRVTWLALVTLVCGCSAVVCAAIGWPIYAAHSLPAVCFGALGGLLGPAFLSLLVRAKPSAEAARLHAAAMPVWPQRSDFSGGFKRWQQLRVSTTWRSSALSGSALMFVGLLIPAGSSAQGMIAGVLGLGLLVRLIVLLASATKLVFSANQLLAAQPLTAPRWYRAHARATIPEGLLLTALISVCVHYLGAPVGFVLGTSLLLLWVLLIDLELVLRYRRRPRRRSVAWTVITVSAAMLGSQAAPLLPFLMVVTLLTLRLRRGPQ